MQHEALPALALKHLDALHVIRRAQRGGNQRLGLAAGEDGGAVRARKNANFNPYIANLVELARVRTAVLMQHLVAEDTLPQRLKVM